MSVRRLSSGGNEGSRPRGCRSNKCPQFWGSGLESNMLCRGITNAQTITKIAKVCCDRILLTHLSNFIILTFVLVSHEIFWRRYFAPPAWCVRGGGATAPLCTPLFTPLRLFSPQSTPTDMGSKLLTWQKK